MFPVSEPRSRRSDVFATLVKAIYQAAKRLGATRWIVATERSLQRRVLPYGLPFERAGPDHDYLGPIAPYTMSLAAFDAVILSGTIPALDDVLDGLAPEFRPGGDRREPLVVSDGDHSVSRLARPVPE